MAVVRYLALAALVVWLGVLQGRLLDGNTIGIAFDYGCGAVVTITLFTMKFLGPPPRAFVPRLAIVGVMIGLAAAGAWWQKESAATIANSVLGFVLLAWYARE